MNASATELAVILLGSVALLIWGVRQVRLGVTQAFGPDLRRMLAAASESRMRAFFAGGFVSGLLQSSTATALLLGSFAGRGLITLPIGLAMMLGADVGATMAAQALAFDTKSFWAILVAFGVGVAIATEADRPRGVSRLAIGLGVMLLALAQISMTAGALRDSWVFRAVLGSLAGEPLLGVVVMAVLTWLAHSSLAMVLFIVSLAGAGVVPIPLALALVLGANIGGAFAPYLALAGSSAAARRVPLGNLLMRGAVAIVLLPLIRLMADAIAAFDFASPARLVVHAHTAFNVIVALVFLPFVDRVAELCARMLPDAPATEDAGAPKHLDPNVMSAPSEALAGAMREALELGNRVQDMLKRVLDAFQSTDIRVARDIEKMDDAVDDLFEAIKLYLVRVSKSEMSDEESRRAMEIMSFVTNLEHIGDIIDKNIMELVAKKIRKGASFSSEGEAELRSFHARIVENMALALNVFATRDVNLARRLVAEKAVIRSAEREAADSHYERLRAGRPESIETSAIHLDLIRDLKRIHGHLAATAYPILEQMGELGESRLRAVG
ncbi:MAG: Na/Pi cotransporter family protein [Beijerinckiaceae bacterium]